uniref:NADH:ubiquinone reductase (H(+)-translocating) n=1 Tax=Conostigmus sp. MM-2013 TaxID=1357450 RepID=V9NK66_9HYME|nr:NADH dehydrogenase subunit 5 [Conostigmus sp. MM-2013]
MLFLVWIMFLVSVFMIMMKLSFIISYSFYYNYVNFEFYMYIDWMSTLFISLVLLISSMVLIYSIEYVSNEVYINSFFYLVLLFVLSMLLMIVSPSILSVLLGWDGLGLVSYCLVSFYQNISSYKSGMLTILMNRIGDVSLMVLLVMMYLNGLFFKNLYEYYNVFIILLLMISAMTKSAQIPFSIWLPAAMAAPTPVSSLVHSSTLVTAGVYLLIRFNVMYLYMQISKLLMVISLMTMIMSGMCALFMYDLKKIIAMSTLSQLGLMFFFISLNFLNLSFFHLLTHALFKSLMFLCSGIIIHGFSNNQDIRYMGNLMIYLPFTCSLFLMASMILMGFPFFSGFFSKDLMMELMFMYNKSFMMFIFSMIALLTSVLYSFRLLVVLIMINGKISSYMNLGGMDLMKYSLFILMIQSIMFGSFLNMLMFMGNQVILNLNFKLMCLMVIFLGGALIFMLIFKNLNLWISLKMMYFFSSMWMMNLMMKYLLLNLFNLISIMFKIIDKGWNEQIYLSVKLYYKMMSKYFMMIYLNNLMVYLVLMVYIFIYLLIFI